MPHVFDAGIAQRAEVRDAIVAQLEVLKKSSRPPLYLRAIATIPRPLRGEGDERGLQMLINALLGQAPAIAIALGRMQFQAGGGDADESDGTLELAVYIASQHERGLVDGRLYSDTIAEGDLTTDPGVFIMLQHVRERLAGQELGVNGIAELRVLEEDEVITLDNLTVWEQRYQAVVNTTVNPARSIAQLLTSIEDRHSLDDIPDGTAGLDPFVTTVTDIDPEVP